MATVEMIMPKMGESVMEGKVLSWLKSVGETIEEDESLLEVATDKVDTEIPSTHSGTLKEILVNEGDTVAVGRSIAVIEIKKEADAGGPSHDPGPPKDPVVKAEELLEAAMVTASVNESPVPRLSSSGKFFSPLVRSIAKKEGIMPEELESINGTGKKGRVTKNDILAYIKIKKSQVAIEPPPSTNEYLPATPSSGPGVYEPSPVWIDEGDELIAMDRMRKMIAERMVASKHISPHVTSFVEADLTNVVAWRNKVRRAFKEREGENLTFTPIFIEAVIRALKDFPLVNVQVKGDNIIKKRNINIGMATALPTGNLIVPVIHHADQLNLTGLTKKVNDLAKRARENKLKPDELQGGTYTVSNVGTFGNLMGTPIIMQPQAAIMAFGSVQKKPSVIETPGGDLIGIRSKMFLSHSYDHRIIDGALGGMFVRKTADYLEAFDIDRKL